MAFTLKKRATQLKQPERKEMGTSGEGIKFQCKLVGVTDVISPEGVDMCAEAFGKLKAQAKKKWLHKERVTLTVISLEGIRIEDETSQKVKHMHPVKRITFVMPDPDDRKIFGYVFSQPDCSTGHKFYALKSKNAKVIVDAIIELFVESVNLRQRAGLAKEQVPRNSSNEIYQSHLLKKSDQFEEEIFQTQLKEMERRLKEEETTFNIRPKDKDQQIENLQKQLTEKEEREQRWKEKIKKTETSETWFRDQLIERTQRVSNFQRKLSEKELECREKEEREENLRTHRGELQQQLRERENLQRQVTEMEDRWRNAQRQLAEREVESANLRQQVAILEDKLESQFCDWIIPRDEIQILDITLGAGGWAEVFEGRYCGCSVAVKQMHETIVSPHNQSLFWREIDVASRCRHPCLLQFIGATNDEGIPLYVTELMETSLRQLLEQRPLSKAEISVIALDVAQALNYLHQKKPSPIIHRDISSGNVLLWRQGNRWRGKVSDYGAAKFKEQKMSIGPGCFAYSAPEVNKSSNQTAKIDVYSFGVLLCEMCSFKQFPDPQKRLAQVNMVRDHGLRELVRRCLKTNPRERPDMTEIISELERLR